MHGDEAAGSEIVDAAELSQPAEEAAPARADARPPAPGASLRMEAAALAALAARMAQRAQDGVTRFALRLDPPELGQVAVRLEIDRAGRARAHLTAERPEAVAELARNVRALEHALSEAGVSLAEDAVSVELASREGGRDAEGFAEGRPSPPAPAKPPSESAPLPAAPLGAVETRFGFAILSPLRFDLRV